MADGPTIRTPGSIIALVLSITDTDVPANNPVISPEPTATVRNIADGLVWNWDSGEWDVFTTWADLTGDHKASLTSQGDGSFLRTFDQALAGDEEAIYVVIYEVASGLYQGMAHEQIVFSYELRDAIAALDGTAVCTITVKDGDTNAVGSCPYLLKNSGGQPLAPGTTHSSTGVFVVNLDEADGYVVTLGPLGGYSFSGNPYTVNVGADAAQSFTLTCAAIAAPAAPGDVTLCNCYVDMRQVEGGQLLGAGEGTMNVTKVRGRPAGSSEILTTDVAAASTDANGRASVHVVRETEVEITLTWPTGETDTRVVTVDDAETMDIGGYFQG